MAKHELDLLYVKNPTQDYFSIRWGGYERGIKPGETMIWQRFLAEHFAKHLTDSILLKKEKAHKDAFIAAGGSEKDYMPKSYLNSRSLRPQTIDTILVGVHTYYQGGPEDPNADIQRQIDQLNPQQPQQAEKDLGTAADPLYGKLERDEPEEQLPTPDYPPMAPVGAPVPAGTPGADMMPAGPMMAPAPPMAPPAPATPPAPEQPEPQPQPAETGRSMKEYMAEAKQLGIKVPFGSSKDQVRELIIAHHG